jgi:hypothetical protein
VIVTWTDAGTPAAGIVEASVETLPAVVELIRKMEP